MKKEYNVTITETLQMTIAVEAENLAEAEEIAEENWSNGDYILGAEQFVGASFTADDKGYDAFAPAFGKYVERLKKSDMK